MTVQTAETIQTSYRMRLAKGWPLRFISHLDTLRNLENAIRRSGLPIRHSEGYNPKQKLSYGPPLAVGFTSQCELIDIALNSDLTAEEAAARLNAACPPGLSVLESVKLPLEGAKSVNKLAKKCQYLCFFSFREEAQRETLLNLCREDGRGIEGFEPLEGEDWAADAPMLAESQEIREALNRFHFKARLIFWLDKKPARPDRWVEMFKEKGIEAVRLHAHRTGILGEEALAGKSLLV